MPFLRQLMKHEHYRLQDHYSGVPSTTPAVQGELFYGVREIVPAFSFRDHRTDKVVKMLDTEPAADVQKVLERKGAGLLQGGSAYSDIFDGGAEESHFCPATIGWGWLLDAINPIVLGGLIFIYGISIVRTLVLMVVEFVLAFVDFFRGLIAGEDLWTELKFVPTRVGICILLRELVTIGAKIDLARGLPVIHLNFLGYDEQSHRRGPTSAFAHWTLRGIDFAIKRIWRAAHRSSRRDYVIWVYSDHGQETTIPYPLESGRTIHEVVAEIFNRTETEPDRKDLERRGIQAQRARWIGGKRGRQATLKAVRHDATEAKDSPDVAVAALGPVGHVYPKKRLDAEEKARFARVLVERANIPLVLTAAEMGKALAWTKKGDFRLPGDAAEILGEHHPFLEEAARDLVELCHHPDAGTLVLSGWRRRQHPISFPQENGSHAGPGPVETHAFALLPADAPIPKHEKPYLRPMDLREAALQFLGKAKSPIFIQSSRKHDGDRTLRIMTYNVHSCVGMDGRVSMARIARVIMQSDPDVVALQELDVGRTRTGGHDQAHEIARELEMDFHFHPALQVEEELYGDAILSRLPMRLIHRGALPSDHKKNNLEPRGALWTAIRTGDGELQFINTHLGLRGQERKFQVEKLLGTEWLTHPDCRRPVVLCGDFNAFPGMAAYRRLNESLSDAQRLANGHRPKGTWFGRYPFGRIDHVFVSEGIEVVGVEVPRTTLARIASDHLPLIVEIRLH